MEYLLDFDEVLTEHLRPAPLPLRQKQGKERKREKINSIDIRNES
jgi:hypothetical protein